MFSQQESREAIMNILNNWGLPLPPHLASLIFSKLSILNLPACRCVSKSWNHLVLDYAASCPKLHLPNLAITITNFHTKRNPELHCFDLHTLNFVANTDTLVGPFVRDNGMYNCCNGLFIIGCQIYNPMTNEFFPIPSFPPELFIEFGFSPKTKQYKLVGLVINPTCEIKILRFGSNHNQWTSIYLPSPIYLLSDGVYMNGVIYLIGQQNGYKCAIYAFDVENENLEVIGILETITGQIFTLQPFNGTIYVIVSTIKPRCLIQIWRMQDKNCWIRDFSVPSNFSNYVDAQAVYLLKAFKDGKILVQIKRKLFWLKEKTKIEKVETNPLYRPELIYQHVFPIESLHFGSLSRILVGDA